MSATKKWSIDKVRRASEEKELRSYKSRNSSKMNVKSLRYDDDGEKNISVNGYDECFLLIPSKLMIKDSCGR